MKRLLILSISSLILLTGCEVVGPSVKVEPAKVKIPGVIIEGQQKHCPPGQAKKGNC